MIAQSSTPETDAEAGDGWSGDAVCVSVELAQKLERERDAARAELAAANRSLAAIDELITPELERDHALLTRAETAEAELAALRARHELDCTTAAENTEQDVAEMAALRSENTRMAVLLTRIERGDHSFAASCDANLVAIAETLHGEKSIHENLSQTVTRLLAERNDARQRLADYSHWAMALVPTDLRLTYVEPRQYVEAYVRSLLGQIERLEAGVEMLRNSGLKWLKERDAAREDARLLSLLADAISRAPAYAKVADILPGPWTDLRTAIRENLDTP